MDYRKDWRQRRNSINKLNFSAFSPVQYSISKYSTDVCDIKSEMKHSFGDDLLQSLQMFPDPVKKNLSDTLFCAEEIPSHPTKKVFEDPKTDSKMSEEPPNYQRSDFYTSLTGITNIFSGVFNLITGAMFQRRTKTEAQFDCFEQFDSASESWQDSNMGDQNKNGRVSFQTDTEKLNMSVDCKTVISQCEDKLDKVRLLLANKATPAPKYRSRRPKRVFVDPSSVEEKFEDAFSPEDFTNLANETYIECVSPFYYQAQELFETDSPKMKIEIPITDKTKIKPVSENTMQKPDVEIKTDTNKEIVTSCEDKVLKLKAMLQERRNRKTSTDSPTEPVSNSKRANKPARTQDKHYKNPDRTTSKRTKSRIKQQILNDMLYAHEIDSEELSSNNNSPNVHISITECFPNSLVNTVSPNIQITSESVPIKNEKDYFDEVSGRFCSTSTESDDSFQIVFTDSPKVSRLRRPSDCDSEDSFIVFEDSPDSCYASVDVFGDQSDAETETDSDISDSGCEEMCKLSSYLCRSVADLTDDNLYKIKDEDEVDCAFKTAIEVPSEDLSVQLDEGPKGLLLDNARKLQKKNQPPKKVQFSPLPPKVHVMRVWAFAAKQARIGNWHRHALDRDRFQRRIADVDMAVSWVLKPQHRSRIMFQRFMPWWNAQKRKELAEKKQLEEERSRREAEAKNNIDISNLGSENDKLSTNGFESGNDKVSNDNLDR